MSFLKKENRENNVVWISLNRPELHNAFNDDFIKELTEEFESLSKAKDVRLIVLTGEGKSFCAGADLNWMKRMKDYSDQENYDDSVRLARLFKAINDCPIPVIGKVNGAALGGGTGLIAVCDYVIASEDSLIGFSEVVLGLVPAVISPFVIRKIGETHARSLFLSGERFKAPKAFDIGLVHQVCPATKLNEETDKIIAQFLKAGPLAARSAKKLIEGVLSGKTSTELEEFTCQTIAGIRVSAEGQEGMMALLEKRKPSWQERS